MKIYYQELSDAIICPICKKTLVPANSEDEEACPSQMCPHVIGIDFNGELQNGYGWKEAEEWWNSTDEPDLQVHPAAKHVTIIDDTCGPLGSITVYAFGEK
jgi:hypothetical protein